jgi:phosphoadenosine phosphosulfate reductase
VKEKYGIKVNVYTPEGCADVKAFEAKFGEKLWERDESMYDFAVKVFIFKLSLSRLSDGTNEQS